MTQTEEEYRARTNAMLEAREVENEIESYPTQWEVSRYLVLFWVLSIGVLMAVARMFNLF